MDRKGYCLWQNDFIVTSISLQKVAAFLGHNILTSVHKNLNYSGASLPSGEGVIPWAITFKKFWVPDSERSRFLHFSLRNLETLAQS